ncbi:MAG: hypothetical protein OIN87_05070 [Candidatus Methanoperedens sp.]|nr:hypothetical protein [Candidatus Methanoperedens sp.]
MYTNEVIYDGFFEFKSEIDIITGWQDLKKLFRFYLKIPKAARAPITTHGSRPLGAHRKINCLEARFGIIIEDSSNFPIVTFSFFVSLRKIDMISK